MLDSSLCFPLGRNYPLFSTEKLIKYYVSRNILSINISSSYLCWLLILYLFLEFSTWEILKINFHRRRRQLSLSTIRADGIQYITEHNRFCICLFFHFHLYLLDLNYIQLHHFQMIFFFRESSQKLFYCVLIKIRNSCALMFNSEKWHKTKYFILSFQVTAKILPL